MSRRPGTAALVAVALGTAALLAGCGGGDRGPDRTRQTLQDVQGAVDQGQTLVSSLESDMAADGS